MTLLDTHLLDNRIPSGIVHINDQTVGDEAVRRSVGSATPEPVHAWAGWETWRRSPRRSG